ARDGIRAAASSSSRGGIYATASGSEPGPEAEGSAAGGGFVWPDNASAASADSNADPIGGSGRGGRVYAIAAIAGAAGRVGSSAGCATTTYVSHAIAVCRASHACTCAVCGSAPVPASPWATPPSLPPSAPPPMASGPGEFTRVISGSALRDLQSAQGVPAAVPPPP